MRLLFQYVTTIGGYPLYNIDLLAVFLSCFLIYRYAKPKKYFPFYIMGLMFVDSILLYLKYKDYITPLNILFPWVMSGVLYASYKGLKYLTDNNKKVTALIVLCLITFILHDVYLMYYEQEFLGFDSSYIFLNSLGLEYNAVELFLLISILAILPLRDITPSKRLKTPSDIIVYAIIAAILVLYGKIIFQSNLYLISIYSSIGLTIIAVMGLNIVTGLCGQISVAHGALSGIGAYTTALLVTKAGFPIYINIPLACLAGAVFGAFIGCFSFLKNFWLGIFTLFFSIYTTHAFENVPFFGGPSGISRIGISGISGLDRIKYLFYVIMGGIVLSFVIYEYVRKSEFGKKMIAIKEGELTSHRETYRYKITAFALSGFLAGLSGSLLSYKTSFINPASFTLTESAFVLYIFMAGGPGSRMGPLLSTIILSFSYEFLRGYVHPLMTIYFALIGIFIYRFLFRDFLVKKMPDLPVR